MNPTLLSFNNGEVSPYLRHRIDVDKMAASAETFENFIATPYGAATKRPGLVHTAMTQEAGANSHLYPFISSDGSRYLLHFTTSLLTIYREDGTVADFMPFLTSSPPQTQGDGMLVTGTLSPNASGLLPFLANDINGRPIYQTGELGVSFPVISLEWIITTGTIGYWRLRYMTSGFNGSFWKSATAEYATQASPHLAPSWSPSGASGAGATPTGTPVISYNPPRTGFWSAPIREIQIEAVNDVLFITHPDTHPLRISRVSDTNWAKEFIPFTQPPVLDQNTDPTKLSVLSNPQAPSWIASTPYAIGYTVFQSGAEWQCTVAHSSALTTQPGIGTNWKGAWRRKLYSINDPVTITHIDGRIIPIAKTIPLYALVLGTFGASYLCITSHTPDSWWERPGVSGSEYGYSNKWAEVVGSSFTLQPPGAYCTNGSATPGTSHVHLNISGASQMNSPQTPTSTAEWQYIRSFPWDTKRYDDYALNLPDHDPINPTGSIHLQIIAGNYYSFRGVAYLAKSTFTVAFIQPDVTPHTNTGTSPTTGLPVTWNSGLDTDFGNIALWEPIEFFLPGHGASTDSPGSAWKLSPRRDDKDFQISHGALTTNNNIGSQPIAMQGAWNINTFGTWSGVFTVQRSSDNGITWETIRSYEAKADRNIADSGTEDIPCLLRLFFTQITGTAASGDQRAVLSPENQSISGYVQADTYVNPVTMTGYALTPVMSGLTPDWSEGAFSTVRGFPRTLTLHESRLCFASTSSNPVSLWLSQSDDLINFEQGVEDTHSVFVTLAAPYQYPIRWIESQRRLFIGTAVALWVAGSETTDAALTPANFNARQYAATGSSSTRPLLAAESLFFTDRKGSRLHQITFSADAESYEPADLSRLAEHLTQPGLAQITWQQTREPSLWAITREGNLLQFCYSRADRLMAWSRHNTDGGTFRNVAILPSDNGDDDVFFIVDRAGGSALERFPQHYQEIQETGQIPGELLDPLFPYHYLDGIAYSGAATTSLTIPATLLHESLTLITVAANGTLTTSTVTPTASPLTIASTTRALLGKPITSRLSSLPVDFPGNQSLRKRLHKIALSLFRSKGGSMFNAASASAQPIPYPSADLFTGWAEMLPDLGNLDEIQVHILHTDPQPFTVRAVQLRMRQGEQ